MTEQLLSTFSWRRCGTTGCEIMDGDGKVIAWTVNETWASILVRLLEQVDEEGIAAILQ